MSNRIPTLNQIRNIPNTSFHNTYTSGSGVGATSISNRRALIRRASLDAGTMKNPKQGKCSGFCTAWGLQPLPGFNFLPIPPLNNYKPIYSYQLYYYLFTNIPDNLTAEEIITKLSSIDQPVLLPLPQVTYEQAKYLEQNGRPPTPEMAHKLVPQRNLKYWREVYDRSTIYGRDKLSKTLNTQWDFSVGSAPINLEISKNLYGSNKIPYPSQKFNFMQSPSSRYYAGPNQGKVARPIIQVTKDPLFIGIYNLDQKNIISNQFSNPSQ